MRSFGSAFALTVLCVATASGQKPDFTGTWRQIDSSGRVRIDRIQHQDPYLKITFESKEAATSGTSLQRPIGGIYGENEYRTDGTEQVDNHVSGRQRWRTVNWQGPVLVFLTVTKDGYRVTVDREIWTLTDSGKTLKKSTRMINMDGVTEKSVTFQKE